MQQPPPTAREQTIAAADRLLREFAVRTGVRVAGDTGRRYLWTDAYAVMALLELHAQTGEAKHLQRAVTLAELVHQILGRHRDDDPRAGWISGLSEADGARRPTAGGLRIGKPLPERRAGDPRERAMGDPSDDAFEERLEWERDGQYFHYLTKWMLALAELALATRDAKWSSCAIDLARAATAGFVHQPTPGAPRRMYWKMSIDLTRPLVASMGQHDPLDGLAAIARVRAAHHRIAETPAGLDDSIDTMRALCRAGGAWATTDPLGIGGLLSAAATLVELTASGDIAYDALLHTLLSDAHRSIDLVVAGDELAQPLDARLAFRELGLSIGLRAVPPMFSAVDRRPDRFGPVASASALRARLGLLGGFLPIAARIEGAWMHGAAQESRSWREHHDINAVMLAASLLGRSHAE